MISPPPEWMSTFFNFFLTDLNFFRWTSTSFDRFRLFFNNFWKISFFNIIWLYPTFFNMRQKMSKNVTVFAEKWSTKAERQGFPYRGDWGDPPPNFSVLHQIFLEIPPSTKSSLFMYGILSFSCPLPPSINQATFPRPKNPAENPERCKNFLFLISVCLPYQWLGPPHCPISL